MNDLPEETPGQRLRRAREAARLSVEELAELVGKAVTTVRAHENGQNRIRSQAAANYAQSLSVEPSWIAYGIGFGPRTGAALERTVRQITVYGNIKRGRWEAEYPFSAAETVVVELPGYEEVELDAWKMDELNQNFAAGSYLITTDLDNVAYSEGDHLILVTYDERKLREVALWQIAGSGEREHLVASPNGVLGHGRTTWDAVYAALGDMNTKDEGVSLAGLVVGVVWRRPGRARKPIRHE